VPCAHDPRCPVNVDPDVLGRIQQRLARVQSHPHLDRAVGQHGLRLGSRGHRRVCICKGDEECVALVVDLVPVLSRKRPAEHVPVVRERLPITLRPQHLLRLVQPRG
jgi:hypothetical protein